jgi:hypothetical protein
VGNVPSFISSFRTLPHAWKSLAIAVTFSVAALGAYELAWRLRGFQPSLTDSAALWCETRELVENDSVVILGSSRLQTGLDPALLSRKLGGRSVVQLAIAGANPIPELFELAADRRFTGVVIFEYMPRRLFTPDHGAMARSQSFVSACRDPSVLAPIEARMNEQVESHTVLLNDELQLVPLLSYIAHHRALPTTGHGVVRRDRYSAMKFSQSNFTFEPDVWEAGFDEPSLVEQFARLRFAIEAITARGGRVILYRSPISGMVLEDEERRFPSAVWFTRAARELGVPAIDYAQLPNAPAVDTPDGEHPRGSDVAAMTETVGNALRSLLAR